MNSITLTNKCRRRNESLVVGAPQRSGANRTRPSGAISLRNVLSQRQILVAARAGNSLSAFRSLGSCDRGNASSTYSQYTNDLVGGATVSGATAFSAQVRSLSFRYGTAATRQ